MTITFRHWANSGAPWIWLTAAAVAASLTMVLGLLLLIAINGLGHFWPSPVWELQYRAPDGELQQLLGQIRETEQVSVEHLRDAGETIAENVEGTVKRYLLKTGNRDIIGLDFRWILADDIEARSLPQPLVVLERLEWGDFYGFIQSLQRNGKQVAQGEAAWQELQQGLEYVEDRKSVV